MTQRRTFIQKLGGMAALMSLPAIARSREKTLVENKDQSQGPFMHVVFFWLKNENQASRKKFLSELRKFIDNVDLIRTKHVGSPAGTDREVIDSTWTYSLILTFDSKKEHDLYQEHELHLKFIENASSLWSRVQVYDSVTLT